jgi:hypothetical protein
MLLILDAPDSSGIESHAHVGMFGMSISSSLPILVCAHSRVLDLILHLNLLLISFDGLQLG